MNNSYFFSTIGDYDVITNNKDIEHFISNKSIPLYILYGYYIDQTRPLPLKKDTNVKNMDQAISHAWSNNINIFGLQYNGEFWYPDNNNINNLTIVKKDGIYNGPKSILGMGLQNNIYIRNNYEYLGGFADSFDRALPYRAGNVSSIEEAIIIANNLGDKAWIFGLQSNGEFWYGDNLKRSIKHGIKQSNNILGDELQNQIFVRKFKYI